MKKSTYTHPGSVLKSVYYYFLLPFLTLLINLPVNAQDSMITQSISYDKEAVDVNPQKQTIRDSTFYYRKWHLGVSAERVASTLRKASGSNSSSVTNNSRKGYSFTAVVDAPAAERVDIGFKIGILHSEVDAYRAVRSTEWSWLLAGNFYESREDTVIATSTWLEITPNITWHAKPPNYVFLQIGMSAGIPLKADGQSYAYDTFYKQEGLGYIDADTHMSIFLSTGFRIFNRHQIGLSYNRRELVSKHNTNAFFGNEKYGIGIWRVGYTYFIL